VAGDTQASSGIDPSVATAARIYDYLLGGHDNFAADRIAALKIIEAAPEAPILARENRKFLGRAVQYLAREAGITQFLDLGTACPPAATFTRSPSRSAQPPKWSMWTMTPWSLLTPEPSKPDQAQPSSRLTCRTWMQS
jgi:hypothetical protein